MCVSTADVAGELKVISQTTQMALGEPLHAWESGVGRHDRQRKFQGVGMGYNSLPSPAKSTLIMLYKR